jgi:oxalate decarboxylase/phosphoglucose isomerase-like protein (cupin superfamily)
MNGEGTAKVSAGVQGASETAPIKAGDAIPIQLNEIHSFENTGTQPLEFLIVGVSRDDNRRVDLIEGANLRSRSN